MSIYDTIIVGAGPAGATAARMLASQGYKVLLIEKEVLPRYKACGGGLTKKCYDLFDFDISDVVEDMTYKMVFAYGKDEPVVLESTEPWIYMVKRDVFDARLVQKACEAGVEFHQGEKVVDVIQQEDGAHIITEKGEYSGKYVVAADGIFSVIGKKFGIKRRYGIALEAEVPVGKEALERYKGTVKVDFNAIRGGYAWIFPKSDSLSIGIGTFVKKYNNLRDLLYNFMEKEDIPPGSIATLKGHPIALNDGSFYAFSVDRIVFAGDAAMLTDPFTGEGIYYAVKSGILAARSIARALSGGGRDGLKSYNNSIKKAFIKDIKVASLIANVFYRDYERVFAIIKKHPNVMNYFGDLVRGKESYSRMPFDIMRDAVGFNKVKKLKRSFEA